MLGKLTPILDENPLIFYEDLYFVGKSGNILACRQGSDKNVKNIFELLPKNELDFVHKNILFSNFHPLLLVKSVEGAMILDFSLFLSKGVFIVIVPHLSEDKLLSVCKERFSTKICPSSSMKEHFDAAEILESDDEQMAFINRLNSVFCANSFYEVIGLTNVELVDLILDISHSICNFVGCEMNFEVCGLDMFEIKNELSLDSLRCMLTSLSFAIRNYSADRSGVATIKFNEIGISLHVNFEIAEEYLDLDLASYVPELNYLVNDLRLDPLSCVLEQKENAFYATGYLWNIPGDYEHIKKDLAEFKYTKE